MPEDERTARRLYRVDRFVVPEAARDEFLGRVRQTHMLLRRQEGFVRDFILERSAEAAGHEIVTMVEWDNEEVVARVRAAVQAMQKEAGFEPKTLFARLGIKAEIATFAAALE